LFDKNPGQLKWVRECLPVFACFAQPMHNIGQRLHETATIKGRREKKREKHSSLTSLVRCFAPSHKSSGLVKRFFSQALHQTLLVNADATTILTLWDDDEAR
jgi:hypothetical protein